MSKEKIVLSYLALSIASFLLLTGCSGEKPITPDNDPETTQQKMSEIQRAEHASDEQEAGSQESDGDTETKAVVAEWDGEFIPLIDRGLFNGKTEPAQAYVVAGLKKISELKKLDIHGEESDDGKIVFLGIGASTPKQEFDSFIKKVIFRDGIIPVNGCKGGKDISYMLDGSEYWDKVDYILNGEEYNLDKKQVQIIWLQNDDLLDSRLDFSRVQMLKEKYLQLFPVLEQQYPNLKVLFLQSRVTTKFTDKVRHVEPISYFQGMTVQSIIDDYINAGNYDKYWIGWSCYTWSDGNIPRVSDKFCLERRDFLNDGVHLSVSGEERVGELMKKYFLEGVVTSALLEDVK